MLSRRALPAILILTAAGILALLLLRQNRPGASAATAPAAGSSQPAVSTPESKSSQRDGTSTTSRRSDRETQAAELAARVSARLQEIADRGSYRLVLGDDALYEALYKLDPGQLQEFLNILSVDDKLLEDTRLSMIGSLCSMWLSRHDSSTDADNLSILAILGSFAGPPHHGVDISVISPTLQMIADRNPDLAARWFTDHKDFWGTPFSAYITASSDDPQGLFINDPGELLSSFSGNTRLALVQIPALVGENRDRLYVALAQTHLTGDDSPASTLAAFQDAGQALAATDPDTAAHLHQLMLQGYGRGLRNMDPAAAIAWLDSGALSAADQQTIATNFIYSAVEDDAPAWTAWLTGKLPDAVIQEKLAHPAPKPRGG